jgi:hypothetical protein
MNRICCSRRVGSIRSHCTGECVFHYYRLSFISYSLASRKGFSRNETGLRSHDCNGQVVKHRRYADRTALLALILGIAKTGLPVRITGVPASSPIIEAVHLAYEGRGKVMVYPSADSSTVTISAYPTSVRGVSALASHVFRNGFKHIATRYRLDTAA